ncbi:amidohydrolase [Alteribacillus iranensis]|uniref:amidohydrolase n=1 Tax=Alteribacillus iranensis TaxID=930128 RepID=UPI000B84DABF|nr:amidohydrolase [Alteribacillus iranensis]
MSYHTDTYFYNAKIFTANDDQPEASAFLVRNGRIEWVGDERDISHWTGQSVDVKGKRVLPGLIEAHMHPLLLAEKSTQIACLPPFMHSIDDIVLAIRKKATQVDKDEWIFGWGYDEGKLKEKRAPNRWDLDRAAPHIPVVLTRSCIHIVSVNSKVLQLAGIDRDTPNPPGGEIERDKQGEPTGILKENAKDLIAPYLPDTTLRQYAGLLAKSSEDFLAHGITAVTDLMAYQKPLDYYSIYTEAREKGFKQRAVLYYMWEEMKRASSVQEKSNREHPVHVGGIKVFSDGSVSGRTAWMEEPFINESDNHGIAMTTKEELRTAAKAAKQNNIQLVVHAMGERAIEMVVDTFEDMPGWLEEGPSVRIEHASFLSKSQMARANKANIGIVTQPIFFFSEIESYIDNIGLERTARSYPVRSLLQSRVLTALSSDAPGNGWHDTVDPFAGIQAAVTRIAYDGTDIGQDERITVEDAIKLYTSEAQKITRIPYVGQLTPGYYADFIILDQDIFTVDGDDIHNIQVEATYMNGSLVYKRV